jgi:hypothetical protein
MADLEYEHEDAVVFDAADEAVVFNAIAPKSSQVAAQRLAEAAGIFGAGNALAQVIEDGLLDARIQFAKLAAGAVVELDCPALWMSLLSL